MVMADFFRSKFLSYSLQQAMGGVSNKNPASRHQADAGNSATIAVKFCVSCGWPGSNAAFYTGSLFQSFTVRKFPARRSPRQNDLQ